MKWKDWLAFGLLVLASMGVLVVLWWGIFGHLPKTQKPESVTWEQWMF